MSDLRPDYTEYLRERVGLDHFEEYLSFPRFFEIETINRCNAACTMCTVERWNRRDRSRGVMGDALWETIADELCAHRDEVRIVTLTRDGEPLLDRKLEQRITRLKEGGLASVRIITNGSLLSEARTRSLLATPLDEIMLSIDSVHKEVYERIRVGLSFEQVIESALRLIRLRDELAPGLRIRVRMVVMKENLGEVEEWARFWTERVGPQDYVHSRKVHSWGNQLEGFEPVHDAGEQSLPCTSPFSTMVIKADGDVVICPVDYDRRHVSGNLSQSTIAEVWRGGPGFCLFREAHLAGRRNSLAFCRSCQIWEPVIRTDHPVDDRGASSWI